MKDKYISEFISLLDKVAYFKGKESDDALECPVC